MWNFLKLESLSGIILLLMAVIALIISNSPLDLGYQFILNKIFYGRSTLDWINQGLMTLFFLVVTLELKREFLTGELSHWKQIFLPAMCALGGMIVPALIYSVINYQHPETLSGWAIPVATDIAFTLGILSLFGKKVPIGLKLFLMALAIFDDLGAIIIIAIFHSHLLAYYSFIAVVVLFGLLLTMNWLKVKSLWLYLIIGSMLWISVLHSGVHATVAGVLLALTIPIDTKNKNQSPLHRLENFLNPIVAFIIMPVFALANAGLSFDGVTWRTLGDWVCLGIILGLFIGKPIGIFGTAFTLIKFKFAKLPFNTTWMGLWSGSILCGIGFTMSLFLGTLAFRDASNSLYLTEVRLGVLSGSFLSGLIGTCFLYITLRKR